MDGWMDGWDGGGMEGWMLIVEIKPLSRLFAKCMYIQQAFSKISSTTSGYKQHTMNRPSTTPLQAGYIKLTVSQVLMYRYAVETSNNVLVITAQS